MATTTRQSLEADLQSIETRLATEPDSTDLLSDRARLLSELGRNEEAKQQYLAILRRDGRHFSTLNNFGVLLHKTGAAEAASRAYQAAIALEPDNPIGHANFADLLVQEGDLPAARSHYEQALGSDPHFYSAHRGLAVVFASVGDADRAQHHQARQYEGRPVETLPYLGTGEPTPVLVLMSAGLGNLPWPDLIDNHVFSITTLATEFFDPSHSLPAHQLIFNAIGDADVCRDALETATPLVARTAASVINHPRAVLRTGRLANVERLGRLPGVITPRTITISQKRIGSPDGLIALQQHGLRYPFLLRSAGYHMGQHFIRVDTPDTLAAAAGALPGDALLAIEYLDTCGTDRKSRKYRVMSIDGRLYPLHLAISHNWKVHYFSAEMSQNAQHQSEEAAFLNDMPGVLGDKAVRALAQISETLGLDYAGIDFGLSPSGELLLFEANATMLIQPPGPEPQWDYRRDPIDRALAAARRLVCDRARFSSGVRRAA